MEMKPVTKTRITFDFDILGGERRNSYEKLARIICAARWGTGIDIFGILNKTHGRLFDFIEKGAIVIDECEYELQEPPRRQRNRREDKNNIGKTPQPPRLHGRAGREASDQPRPA
jgi:hypothetical protein